MIRTSLPIALSALALAAALLTGCASSGPAATTPTSEPTAESPDPTPTPTPTPTPVAVTATCENTATAEALASFAEFGWTAGNVQDPWIIVEDFAAGISCVWGDYSTGNDTVSWLAWAPLPEAQADGVIAALMNQGGWIREDSDAGVYVTAADASMMPNTDAEGYATTYLFADGQVKAATTKSELVAITAPPGFVP